MEKIAVENNINNLTYTKKHGEADKEHSDLAHKAMLTERASSSLKIYQENQIQWRIATDAVVELLYLIFKF